MTSALPVSVVVPVKNEERMLGECLTRLSRFAEIIVVDSQSTDRTASIAKAFNARFVDFSWNGQFPKKRNWVLLNLELKSKWVLFLDADEFVSDEFCDQLEQAIATDTHVGYWLNYTNHFLGRPLKHGIPQKKLALFRTGAGLYERIEEDHWSKLDMEVHEHPVLDGTLGEIHARIDHRDDRGIMRFVDRHREYATWEANRTLAIEQKLQVDDSGFTARQKFKYRQLSKWWFPYAYFFGQYFVKMGFLDGHAGLQYANYKFWYFSTVRLLLREMKQKQSSQPKPL